jgi:4,5-DOPA dioxygenase extradiol
MAPSRSPAASGGRSQEVWPVVFVGHGTPLNALRDNTFTRAWARVGETLGRPRAILSISGHWYTRGTRVTAMERPATLYDFGYQNMFHLSYPAPGSPALAARVAKLLKPSSVALDHTWGFDHGTWSVLLHMFPAADIPTVQLSIDGTSARKQHRALGRMLRPLREEGVLIMCSGNIVHNLEWAVRRGEAEPFDWAARFDLLVREKLLSREWDSLEDHAALSPDAELAVPTPDHYLPLLYALGAAEPTESISFPVEAIDRGSMSMRTIIWGGA